MIFVEYLSAIESFNGLLWLETELTSFCSNPVFEWINQVWTAGGGSIVQKCARQKIRSSNISVWNIIYESTSQTYKAKQDCAFWWQMFVSKEVKRFGWSGVNISTASLPALTAVFGRQTPAKPENTLQLWRTLNTQRRGGGKNFGLCPPFPYPPQNGQNKKATGKEK